jgi:hypothetical protein
LPLGAALCLFLWHRTGNGLWAALARSSAWLNILNLISVWILDGAQAAHALAKTERWVLMGLPLLFWLSRGEGVFSRRGRIHLSSIYQKPLANFFQRNTRLLPSPCFSHSPLFSISALHKLLAVNYAPSSAV